jgi:hypothetical protein
MPDSKEIIDAPPHKVRVAFRSNTIAGFKELGELSRWREALMQTKKSGDWPESGAFFMDLGKFGSSFFEARPPNKESDQPGTTSVDASRRLPVEFEKALRSAVQTAITQLRYHPHEFIKMLDNLGGVQTAKRLLEKKSVSEGFVKLWMKGRKDLTTESIVLNPRWTTLLTAQELSIAKRRLAKGN